MSVDASAAGPNFHPGNDETFRRALGEFARKIGDRATAEQAPDPVMAAEKRREALDAYDRDRMQRWLIGSSVALGIAAVVALLGLAMMWLPISLGRAGVQGTEEASVRTRISQPPAPVEARFVEVPRAESIRAKAPSTSASAITLPAVPNSPDVSMAELKAWSAAAATPGGLAAAEIREVQGRLLNFGFDPGRIDGADGPRTRAAAQLYRQRRGLVPGGDVVDRNLLAALRQDPTPRIVQRPPRSQDPFEGIVRWWRSL